MAGQGFASRGRVSAGLRPTIGRAVRAVTCTRVGEALPGHGQLPEARRQGRGLLGFPLLPPRAAQSRRTRHSHWKATLHKHDPL